MSPNVYIHLTQISHTHLATIKMTAKAYKHRHKGYSLEGAWLLPASNMTYIVYTSTYTVCISQLKLLTK